MGINFKVNKGAVQPILGAGNGNRLRKYQLLQ